MNDKVLSREELRSIDGYFRACNYLSVASLYLKDNPLLRRPLKYSDIKTKLVGHFGSAPGQTFTYIHLDRIIKKYDLNMMWISGPGHAGQATMIQAYFEGTYNYRYPKYQFNEEGLKNFIRHFSFPGGTSSHVAPMVPGSIHEGGELGYSLLHGYGAVLDNKDLICAVMVGDGEAETGSLATSWHVNKFINPQKDGAVIPILHLNGYKIANPSILARISNEELIDLFKGYGYVPYVVEGDKPSIMHEKMAKVMEEVIQNIKEIWTNAREKNFSARPLWPMIILKTPKGWGAPKKVDGENIEGTFRSHQIPVKIKDKDDESHIKILEEWLKSYKVEELFDEEGALKEEYRKVIPDFSRCMSNNIHTNGGELLKELVLPELEKNELDVKYPGKIKSEAMRNLGSYLKEVIKLNKDNHNFKIFGPDEALSNRLNDIFNETDRRFMGNIIKDDDYLKEDGDVFDSFLSENVCEGLLEGYLLTGRHGIFHSYEAFLRIVDSMISQHAKWIKLSKEVAWRKPISSLNLIATSHVFQQDHNGYTHQDPGLINHLITKKADIARIYLPIDTNTLIATVDHVLKTKNYINLIVASKQEMPEWLNMKQAINHTKKGIGIFSFASNDLDGNPDIVLACAGDTPTLEIMATQNILKEFLPNVKVRVVNVVDLMKLDVHHPHGLTDSEYDMIFTKNKPIIFAFHGYPSVIHELTYNRNNQNMHVRGYIEEGTITTSFDMRVQNKLDRFHLALLCAKYLPSFDTSALEDYAKQSLKKHHEYIIRYGVDMPSIREFKWLK